MSDRLEDRIRDYLADNLNLIESGLALVKREYVLANESGAGGKIDILARDRFGMFVIIEIKRSDKAARQTLNEIHKYVALLLRRQGLDEKRVRVAIVSTDWNELRLPLSECEHFFPYAIDPISIKALPDGTVTDVERVQLIPKTGIIELSRMQCVYCFRDERRRDAALPMLVTAATKAALREFVILKLDYTGKSAAICHPFGLYLIFSSPLLNASRAESEAIKAQVKWDDGLSLLDENFLVAVMDCFKGDPDDFYIACPEKLTTIVAEWKISEFSRHGRLSKSASLLSDAEVMHAAQAVGGGSPIYFYKLCTPKHSAAWNQLQMHLKDTLGGMPEWERIVPRFLEEITSEAPTASVSVNVFNPTNLPMSLYPVAWAGDYSRCPCLEIVVEDDRKKKVRVLVGLLAWTGIPINRTPEQIVNDIYGSVTGWMTAQHFHQTHLRETEMLNAHNLVAPLVEFTYGEEVAQCPRQIITDGSCLERKPFDLDSVKDMTDFSAANKEYLGALKVFLESHMFGLSGSDLMQRFNSQNE